MNSMKDAPKGSASPAGSPPHSHAKTSKKGRTLPTFKNFIRFNVSNSAYPSAVVGPTKGNSKHFIGGGRGGRGTWAERIGQTHEYGGQTTVEKRITYFKSKKGKKGGFSNNTQKSPWSGKQKRFNFQLKNTRSTKDKTVHLIEYRANYPARPFAAPALLKTTQKMRRGEFGIK